MSLRHIRVYRGSFFSHCLADNLEEICEQDLLSLQQMVEESDPYKLHTIGFLLKNAANASLEWAKVPAEMTEKENEYLAKARRVASFFSKKELHGIRYGRAVKQVYVPKFSKGVLISWPKGSKQYVMMEHNGDSHLVLKKIMHTVLEDVCHLYMYYFTIYHEESPPAQITSRRPPEAPQQDPMDTSESRKRDGPETRTIVMAPEKKKARYEYAEDEGPTEQELLLNSLWWMTKRPLKVNYPSDEIWFDNHSLIMQYNRTPPEKTATPSSPRPRHYIFHLHGKTEEILYMDMRTTEIFRVDADTDVMTEEKLAPHWDAFELSDFAELKQFVDEGAFFKMHISQVTEDMVIVDCTWVRKFKRNPDKTMKAKSRLCARGFLDPQKASMPTRSTTATRLSQRILVSLAAAMNLEIESLDVSGAFLKGLSFDQVRKKLRERGVSPRRLVAIIPPANVWRQLAKMDKSFDIPEAQMSEYLLGCNKPVYGLNDAPLAWQLCLHEFVEELGGQQSVFDENMFFWKTDGLVSTILTTHVDDIAVATNPEMLESFHKKFTKKFGKVTREKMPFQHCGMVYEKVAQGYRIQQYDFTSSLKMTEVENDKDEERSLTKEETTKYRSILGGLLWLTATRIDLIADVCRLQTFVTQAKVKHLKMANAIVKRAQDKKYKDLGIIYRHLPQNASWRLACVHDASSASQGRTYANEGIMVFLTVDRLNLDNTIHEIDGLHHDPQIFGGPAHLLWAQGNKAKRISYSTSHGETLAAINGLESSSLVSLRLGELLMPDNKPSLASLAALQEKGVPFLPVDVYTDCRDFYELTTGVKAMPQDKGQRIYIMAHREARLCGRIRWVIMIPTQCMTSDALTKVMVSTSLNELLTTGIVRFFNVPNHPIEARRLPVLQEVEEGHLHQGDEQLLKSLASSSTSPTTSLLVALCFLAVFQGGEAATKEEEDEGDKSLYYMMAVIAVAAVALWHMAGKLLHRVLKCCIRYAKDKESQCDLFSTSGLIAEVKRLRQQIEELEREKSGLMAEKMALEKDLTWSLNQTKLEETAHTRLRHRLRQYEDITSTSASSAAAERGLELHRELCPLGKEIYYAPTGEVWHAKKSCHVLQGRATHKILSRRACTHCSG